MRGMLLTQRVVVIWKVLTEREQIHPQKLEGRGKSGGWGLIG